MNQTNQVCLTLTFLLWPMLLCSAALESRELGGIRVGLPKGWPVNEVPGQNQLWALENPRDQNGPVVNVGILPWSAGTTEDSVVQSILGRQGQAPASQTVESLGPGMGKLYLLLYSTAKVALVVRRNPLADAGVLVSVRASSADFERIAGRKLAVEIAQSAAWPNPGARFQTPAPEAGAPKAVVRPAGIDGTPEGPFIALPNMISSYPGFSKERLLGEWAKASGQRLYNKLRESTRDSRVYEQSSESGEAWFFRFNKDGSYQIHYISSTRMGGYGGTSHLTETGQYDVQGADALILRPSGYSKTSAFAGKTSREANSNLPARNYRMSTAIYQEFTATGRTDVRTTRGLLLEGPCAEHLVTSCTPSSGQFKLQRPE